uniref:Uncharacterized protein n=1 Tax=Lepeophtheirus salmonis TaxID=72036 RepID=A0A0K2UUT9_LEPSM
MLQSIRLDRSLRGNLPPMIQSTDITMDLIAIVNDSVVETCVMERVAKYYRLDLEQLQSDNTIFQQLKADIDKEDMVS